MGFDFGKVLTTAAGAALGGVGGALGSALLNRVMGSSSERGVADANARNEALQREFAQSGIRWRVEDAKAAGIHPLYALSGGGAAFAPNPVVVGAGGDDFGKQMGQNFTRAISAQESDDDKEERELRKQVLLSQVDQNSAQAQYYRSQAVSPVSPSVGFASGSTGASAFPFREVGSPSVLQLDPGSGDYPGDYPGKFDTIKPKPVEVESMNPAAPWVAAGPGRPGFGRFRVSRNMEMLLPNNEEGWSEGIESVPHWMYPLVYQANKDFYGKSFWRLLVQELGANSPLASWVAQNDPDVRLAMSQGGRRFHREFSLGGR